MRILFGGEIVLLGGETIGFGHTGVINAETIEIHYATPAATVTLGGLPTALETQQLVLETFPATVTGQLVPLVEPGLEFALPLSKLEYRLPRNRLHFSFREED